MWALISGVDLSGGAMHRRQTHLCVFVWRGEGGCGSVPGAAATSGCTLGVLKQLGVFSYSSGDRKFKINVSARLDSLQGPWERTSPGLLWLPVDAGDPWVWSHHPSLRLRLRRATSL